MMKSIKKKGLFRPKGANLLGLGLIIVGLAALFVFGPDLVLGQASSSKGKPPSKPQPQPALYRVYFSTTGLIGIDTVSYPSCNEYGYVLAEWGAAHNFLHANGTFVDPANNQRIPLKMSLLTDVPWQRNYDAGKGLDGTFHGCYGETASYDGALFITFTKVKRQPIIRFTWYFDYYTAENVREHFCLFSEDIPFQAWTGENIEKQVEGWFDLQYYLNDPDHSPSYVSLTGGEGRTLNVYLRIEKVTQ
jgi:hypothetical protein